MLSHDRLEWVKIFCHKLGHGSFKALATTRPVAVANSIWINVKLLEAYQLKSFIRLWE